MDHRPEHPHDEDWFTAADKGILWIVRATFLALCILVATQALVYCFKRMPVETNPYTLVPGMEKSLLPLGILCLGEAQS